MHESGWAGSGYSDECGSHTTLRPVYADETADYIDRMFSRMAAPSVQRPARPSSEPAEPLHMTTIH